MISKNYPTHFSRRRLRDNKAFILLTFGAIAAFYAMIFFGYFKLACPDNKECATGTTSEEQTILRCSYDQMARKLIMEASPYPGLEDGMKMTVGSALNHLAKKIAIQSRPHI